MQPNRDIAFKKGIETLARTWTAEIQKEAKQAGWPPKYAAALIVRASNLTVEVKYPDKYSAEIEDLEYGTQDERPKPVIRVFMDKHSAEFYDLIQETCARLAIEEGFI